MTFIRRALLLGYEVLLTRDGLEITLTLRDEIGGVYASFRHTDIGMLDHLLGTWLRDHGPRGGEGGNE